MPTVLLYVKGMNSPDDEDHVRSVLLPEQGVFGAVASRVDACAEVDIEDDLVTVERLIELLEEAGFQARLGG